jgi:hypothetical protein
MPWVTSTIGPVRSLNPSETSLAGGIASRAGSLSTPGDVAGATVADRGSFSSCEPSITPPAISANVSRPAAPAWYRRRRRPRRRAEAGPGGRAASW